MKTRNLLRYFLIYLAFAAVFAVVFILNKANNTIDFIDAANKVPSIRNFGSTTIDTMKQYFGSYGFLGGFAFGFIAYIISLVLYSILKAVRLAKFSLTNMLVLFLVYGSLLALAIELLYYENRFSALAIAIIFYIGDPLLYAAAITLALILIVYSISMIRNIFRKKTETTETPASPTTSNPPSAPTASNTIATLLLIIIMPFLLSGCSFLGGLQELMCVLVPDSEHCYQGAAVDQGDADECEKIKQPAKFKDMGSNPPKDKCYLMIAQNTGDLDACNKIQGGLMSYTREECILGASIENENPSGCTRLTGNDRAQCVSALGPKITPDKVLEVDKAISDLKEILKGGSDPDLEKQLKGLETNRTDMLGVMTKENKTEYDRQSDPMNQEIIGDFAVGEIDSATKNKLVSFNERLKAQGLTMSKDQYEAFKDYFKFVNDPENDIEKMNDSQIVKDRWNEKVGNVVDAVKFWNSNNTKEEESVDQQLRFYERMLERQAAIIKGLTEKQQDFDRNLDMVTGAVKDKVQDEVKDAIIEGLFGSMTKTAAGITTTVVGEALDTVKAEAKSAEFRGLVRAYNSGMAEELSKFGGDVNRAHAEVVKKLSADAYTYAGGNSFAKYGNLLENKDCDGSNPHCINRDVFWKAMKKSYNYQHQSK